MENERPVVFFDQLESGMSDRPNDTSLWKISNFVDQLDTIQKALNLEEFHLLGSSWGGAVVIEYLLSDYEGIVKSAIFSGPLLSTPKWISDAEILLSRLPQSVQDTIKKYEALKKFSRDLTDMARRDKLDPVIGRDDEILRVIQVLSRRTKNNPVLIGEAGVGGHRQGRQQFAVRHRPSTLRSAQLSEPTQGQQRRPVTAQRCRKVTATEGEAGVDQRVEQLRRRSQQQGPPAHAGQQYQPAIAHMQEGPVGDVLGVGRAERQPGGAALVLGDGIGAEPQSISVHPQPVAEVVVLVEDEQLLAEAADRQIHLAPRQEAERDEGPHRALGPARREVRTRNAFQPRVHPGCVAPDPGVGARRHDLRGRRHRSRGHGFGDVSY